MIDSLERYVDPAFVYRFTHGPNVVTDEVEARSRGINCISLAHIALRELFNRTLPAELDCYEMFSDNTDFETVDSQDLMQRGDLAWFGPSDPRVNINDFTPTYNEEGALLNWRDSAVKHVAVYTGARQEDEPLMLHSTHIEGTNTVWPLSRFAHFKRYEKIYRISRLRQDDGENE